MAKVGDRVLRPRTLDKAAGRNSVASHPETMAKIVDIGRKPDVKRRAVATGTIVLRPATLRAVRRGPVEKGDVLASAEVAALHGMKSVWQVLPHCHPIPITSADVTFVVRKDRIVVTTKVEATYKTGVEMEALYGVTVALLTVWDMVKSMEKDSRGQYPSARIEDVRVVEKAKAR
jgi:cyclic pyranopterin phosphate synthase